MRSLITASACLLGLALCHAARAQASCTQVVNGITATIPCPSAPPARVAYTAPNTAAITTANTPVTVFAPGAVTTGCDFVNTGSSILYLDFTAAAAAGAPTSIPLQPGQSFHCPFPPAGAVSAVASQPQPFVALRY